MTEDDWDELLRWNNDPEVLYFSEGDDITSWSVEVLQEVYRSISKDAYMFMGELEGAPIAECWLQRMNLPWLLEQHRGQELWRIDLVIGEKQCWNQGWGTKIIRLLTDFGFQLSAVWC